MTVSFGIDTRIFICLGLLLALGIGGCVGTRETQKQTVPPAGKPPAVLLGSEQIHSPGGDLTARIPQGWVTVEVEKLDAPQVFAMTCDPDYTMSIVFCEIPVDNEVRASFAREGMNGLIDASFQRRRQKSMQRARKIGSSDELTVGSRRFGLYSYTTDSVGTATRVAIFFTNTHLYECSITSLNFTDHDPASADLLREVHDIVLGSVWW